MLYNRKNVTSMKAKAMVDKDPTLGYEYNSFPKKIFNFFFVPILNNLPKKFQEYIKKSNKNAKEVIDNATTHVALEIIYHGGKTKHKSSFIKKLFRSVWFNLTNTKGVRNRLKLTKRELRNTIKEFVAKNEEVHILSIAAGSARAVIESIIEAEVPKGYPLSVTFLDKNPKAAEYSKVLIDSFPELETVDKKWHTMTIGSFFDEQMHLNKKFTIIEMVGLIDYFSDEKAIDTFSKINSMLHDNGMFITANICPNPEQKFISSVIDWSMIYRHPHELSELLHTANFHKEYQTIFHEPLRVHGVIVSRKNDIL